MDDQPPIHVLRDGKRIGPFTIDELLEQVDEGQVDYEDICLSGDAGECQRVREILDWEEEGEENEGETHEVSELIPESEETKPDIEPEPEFETKIEPAHNPDQPPTDPSLMLYAGHPSLLSFPKSLIVLALSLGLGIYFRETSGWILFCGLVLALVAVSYIILERCSRLYVITPKRVEIEKGLIAKSSNEVRISDIRTINVVRRGFRGMIGIGRVEFASSGGTEVEVAFDEVWAANRVKGLVRRLQDVRG